jgi:hypothetical protein
MKATKEGLSFLEVGKEFYAFFSSTLVMLQDIIFTLGNNVPSFQIVL